MKVVKLTDSKLNEEELRSNQNMHKPEDVQAVADVVYSDARNFDEKAQEHAEEVYDELEDNAKDVTPKDPDDGNVKLEKNMYAEPISLDESLFEAYEDDGTVDSELANFLEENIEWLQEEDEGCATYKLDDRLAVCVGWEDGFDPNDENVIHSKSDPRYAIVAGIKVYTSDDMRTDYDWISYPYFANGEVVHTGVSISPDENLMNLAGYFLKEYSKMADWEIEEDGLVIKSDDGEEEIDEIEDEEEIEVEESCKGEECMKPLGRLTEAKMFKSMSLEDAKKFYSAIKDAKDLKPNDSFLRNALDDIWNHTKGLTQDYGGVSSDEKDDESLSCKSNKPLTEKKVEGADDNVYQLVYDALFVGNKNFRPHIADGNVYDWEQSLIMLPGYNNYDLGIALEKEEDGAYAKAVADKLGLKYEVKPTNRLSDDYKFIATVRIPDDIADKDATEFINSLGLDMNTIRPSKKKNK